MTARAVRRCHLAVGALVCLVIPGASYLDGSGRLAYTMFTEVREYRLEVRATGKDGRTRIISAAELGRATTSSAAQFFYGAETFRRGTTTYTPGQQIGAIAALACAVSRGTEVDVTLYERARATAPVASTHVHRICEAP